MGNPQHFSRELTRRGQQLLDNHYNDLTPSAGGLPLKATFLLSISMPMVILPYERIKKTKAHMNDGTLDPALAAAVVAATDAKVQHRQTPYFVADTWEHAVLPKGAAFPNLADGLPDAVADELDLPGAKQAAADLSVETFLSVIRNGLAHGCVLFLNAQGRTERDAAVQRFAFVGTDLPRNPQNLLFLRTTMKGYRAFLQSWSTWLQASGVQKALEEVVEPDADDDDAAEVSEPTKAGA